MPKTRRRISRRRVGGVTRSLADELVGQLQTAKLRPEAAQTVAMMLLSMVAAYESKPEVAAQAREAVCALANRPTTLSAEAQKALVEKATESKEMQRVTMKAGVRWDSSLFGVYTTATAALAVAGVGVTQAARRVLEQAGVSETTLNLALYSIPCLLNILPAALDVAVPGYSYASPPGQ